MSIVFKTLVFLILATGISACGGGSKDNPDDPPLNDGPPKTETGTSHETITMSALSGTWNTNCSVDEDYSDQTIFNTETWTIDEAAGFTLIDNHFIDDMCTTPTTSDAVLTSKGNLILGKEITTEDGVTARELDFRFTEGPIDGTFYTLVYIDPGKPDELIPGQQTQDRDSTSADKRPNSLNFNDLLFRQGNNTPSPPADDTPPPVDDAPPPRDDTPPAADSALLSGTWNSGCLTDADATIFTTLTLIMDETDTSLSWVIRKFINDTCATPTTIDAVNTWKGNFILGNEITTGDGVTAQEIDWRFTERNGNSFEAIFYTLVYIDPAKPDEMFVGQPTNDRNASSVDKRPTTLNFNIPHFRQGNNTPPPPVDNPPHPKPLSLHY